MDRSDYQRISHMKSYCEDIADAVMRLGYHYDSFLADTHYTNSISMCIMQIGELSIGLSEIFKNNTAEKVQWGLMRGMRNMFAHTYAKMDKEVIWDVATRDIPNLLRFCETVLEEHAEKYAKKPKDRDSR